jgi:acyl dehydratase
MAYEVFDVNKYGKGYSVSLGSHTFSEEEITEFAKQFDPLPFHTDPHAGKESRFGRLISSGAQPFNYFHVYRWIPLFGKTVIAGLEINSWKFLNPVGTGDEMHCKVCITDIKLNAEKKHAVISWKYEIFLSNNLPAQVLESNILHYTG